MTTPSDEPLERGNEADLVEQDQELDGTGSVTPGPDVTPVEADEADALEQGAHITTEDDEAYPHLADETD